MTSGTCWALGVLRVGVRGHSCHQYQMSGPINRDKLEVELDGCLSMRMVALHAEESDYCLFYDCSLAIVAAAMVATAGSGLVRLFQGALPVARPSPKVRKPKPMPHEPRLACPSCESLNRSITFSRN